MPNLPVRTDIKPSYHPDVVQGDYITHPDNANLLGTARDVLAQTYQLWGSLNDATSKVENKKMLAQRARKEVDATLPQLDRARAQLVREREKLRDRIAKTLRPEKPGDPSVASEIRSYLRSEGQPLERALERIKAGDLQSVQAVLSAPAYLSGLKPEQYQLVEDAATRRFHDADRGLIEDIGQAVGSIEAAGSAFVAHHANLEAQWNAPPPDSDERDRQTIKETFKGA